MMAVFFDIDGTLLDHDSSERAGAVALHRMIGSPVPIGEFLVSWSAAQRYFTKYLNGDLSYQDQGRARIREIIDCTLDDEAADRIFAEYRAAYEGSWSLFPDVRSCLDMLWQHRLGIISNGRASEQRSKLISTDIADRFDAILISEECGCGKPSPEIFHRACAAVGEKPHSVVYVGDRYDLDAYAARHAGLAGVWLDRNGKATPQHESPLIRTLDELPGCSEIALSLVKPPEGFMRRK
jgi:putative hydrolase of the HAD superfamily